MNKLLLCASAMLMSLKMTAGPIDLNQAQALAADFLVTGTEPELVAAQLTTHVKAMGNTQVEATTAPYYIFSRGAGKGYVIVSGDECLPKILGYTEQGDYDENNVPDYLKAWLQHMAEITLEAQANDMPARTAEQEAKRRTISEDWTEISPLLTCHWHQSWPYNNLCPFLKGTTNRAITGCVCTAAAQILYYFRKDLPSTLLATTPTYGYGDAPVTESYPKGTPIKWDIIQDSYGHGEPAAMQEAVALANAAIGAATWLTYGSSTSGQISAVVNTYNSYFNVSSTCIYKGGAQSAWEDRIYKQLAAGRPVLYSGVHADQGGHAVVLDGYQASTGLFHFNFGWGGKGDGYYTVDDETGMNHFNTSQGMVCDIVPRQQKIEAKITLPNELYFNRTNDITVKVKNGGTLDYKDGVYLYANSSGKAPTTNDKPKDENLTVLSNSGAEYTFPMQVKPVLKTGTWYFFLCDKNRNVLAKAEMNTSDAVTSLQYEGIRVSGTSETEQHEGNGYTVVYNDRALAYATINNLSPVDYEATPYVSVYKSTDQGKTFEYVGNRYTSVTIPARTTKDVEFNITNSTSCPIEVGPIYYITLDNPIKTLNVTDTLAVATTDTIARFTLRKQDLTMTSYTDDVMKFSGHWDPVTFKNLINRHAPEAEFCLFDLTEVANVQEVPSMDNNSLFYVREDADVRGDNVVKAQMENGKIVGGVCERLHLLTGKNFIPQSDFTAKEAVCELDQPANRWQLVCLPFNATVNDGVIARKVLEHNASGINNKTEDVTTIVAGTPHLVMTSSDRLMTLTGKDVTVSTQSPNQGDPAFVGSFVNTTVPAGAMMVDLEEEKQMFVKVIEGTDVEAMQGYFFDQEMNKEFRAYSNMLLDPSYLLLGEQIQAAWDALSEYQNMVTSSAYKDFQTAIAKAQNSFSNRENGSAAVAKEEIEQLVQAENDYKKNINKAVNHLEVDYTGFLVNPSFEDSRMGWNTTLTSTALKLVSQPAYYAVGADGAKILYNRQGQDNPVSVEISQTVEGLPEGYYKIMASLGSDEDNQMTLFAGDKEVGVSAHPFGEFYLVEAVIEDIHVGADGVLDLGVKAGAWFKADNFRLYYTGNVDSQTNDISDVVVGGTAASDVVAVGGVGYIKLASSSTVSVTVYTTDGRAIRRVTVDGHATVSNLGRGIYIVGNQKVMVK